ncbi:hypothetical protein OUZ56_027339 [Daphnia magna]|uniref:Uncharacterized protein n=1 Tax=Daphnia magna TaxID=35525 RepID=A0ABQ9ZQV2_9CRUS|nr:hypothetical protein OUZ56_027339 [Daphnia magna]
MADLCRVGNNTKRCNASSTDKIEIGLWGKKRTPSNIHRVRYNLPQTKSIYSSGGDADCDVTPVI